MNVVDLGGKNTVLSEGYWSERGLAWSPGGQESLFSASPGGGSYTVYGVTLGGNKVPRVATSLPKSNRSLCPECLATVPATLSAEDGQVWMRKSCPSHGTFSDIVFSDSGMYLRMEEWYLGDGRGFSNPVEGAAACPEGCGICGEHTAHTSLANVDLTSRCNLSVPFTQLATVF